MTDASDHLLMLRQRLAELETERRSLLNQIAALEAQPMPPPEGTLPAGHETSASISQTSSSADKIALFRSLFRGRADVFPKRWENAKTGKSGYAPTCANEWKRGLCEKPRIKCSACQNQAFVPVSDEIISRHLSGRDLNGGLFVAGVYALTPDNSCAFLAADFDDAEWHRDVSAFATTCALHNIPVGIERSRSGNGAHAWIFFEEPVPAAQARRLGAFILTETMDRAPDIGFSSYDRFFPSQDSMPIGGFGNLIALPLQGAARKVGNSVFVDENFAPFTDQWAMLAGIKRLSRIDLDALVERASASGRILAVRVPLDDDDEEPWLSPPSRRRPPPEIKGDMPPSIELIEADQIYVPRLSLPPSLVARLMRLAAFQNPAFYAAQAMRLSTHGIPRIISCAELTPSHVGLPRGCKDAALELFGELGIAVSVRDHRNAGRPISAAFAGELRPDQAQAARALTMHDTGVLAATTAFGKTVIAAHMIAARGVNTLILVHRRQLMDQWTERLASFLNIDRANIGTIGDGKRKPKGIVDVALIQSLVRKGEVDDVVGDYGQLIVDECHHLPAVSFELVTRRAKSKYVLGLSATPTRKDGHHPIIFMQCGPIRHCVDAKGEAAKRPFSHFVRFRSTGLQSTRHSDNERLSIQDIYRAITLDNERNDLIVKDVLAAIASKRSPVIITERTEHLTELADRLGPQVRHVITLRGGQSDKERRALSELMASICDDEERVIVATGRYLGEGFDDPRLDTLFLTMPVSWRGTLAQYAGRLHRLHHGKRDVIIYDYVDDDIPVLARMANKRRLGYLALGYVISQAADGK